jgi:hypothetical protein
MVATASTPPASWVMTSAGIDAGAIPANVEYPADGDRRVRDAGEARVDQRDAWWKCAPETGPNMGMIANGPAAVAAAIFTSSKPMSPGESCWAAVPEPMTIAPGNGDPRNSASRRHARVAISPDPDAHVRRRSPVALARRSFGGSLQQFAALVT